MSLVFLILGLAGLLWGTVLVMRSSLLCGCAIYLVSACCIGAHLWSIDVAGLTWSLDRFFLVFLCLALLIQWRMGKVQAKSISRGEWLLLSFIALLCFSTLTHDWRASGPDNDSVLMHLVNGYLIPLFIYFVATRARADEKQLRYVYVVMACFGAYLAVTALLEVSQSWALVFPSYISDPEVGTHFGRARGPMLQSARLGMYLIVCAIATVQLFAWNGRWSRYGLLATAVLAPIYLAAIYCTYTRGVWLGAAGAILVVMGCTLKGRWRAIALLAVVSTGAVLVAAKGESLIAFKRDTSAADTAESTYMRASFAYVSWLMFQDRPITGFGFGQFPSQSIYYLSDRSSQLRLEQIRGYIHHNTYLSLLVELGIIGLLLYVAIYIMWTKHAWQLWRSTSSPFWVRAHALLFLAILPAYLLQMLFREVSYSPVENGLMFFMAGTTSSLYAKFVLADSKQIHASKSELPDILSTRQSLT